MFKAMAGGPRNWLLGWLFPSILFNAACGFFLLPRYPDFPLPDKAAERTLVLVGASILVALLLSALSVTLYQILEGYRLWPPPLARARIAKHRKKREALSAAAQQIATQEPSESGLAAAFGLEKLYSYPIDPGQIAPSSFGNAIRSFETYGYDRYLLDSQTLWNELSSSVPENLRQEEANARAPVDFAVSLLYLDAVYAAALLVTVCSQGIDGGLIVSGVVCAVLFPVLYVLAITSCAGWGQAVRAMVNVGRLPLATALGLEMPRTVAAEREMWQAVSYFVADPYDPEESPALNRFRKTTSRGTGSRAGS